MPRVDMPREYSDRIISSISPSRRARLGTIFGSGSQDTSRGGKYHNKKFKDIAESMGLVISHDPVIGHHVAALNSRTVPQGDRHVGRRDHRVPQRRGRRGEQTQGVELRQSRMRMPTHDPGRQNGARPSPDHLR